MPKLVSSLPKYRLHKASGQALVTLNGTDFYLGPWQSKPSRLEYDRVVGEWIQNGRRLPTSGACDLTVVEIIAAYCKHAERYYVKNGKRTREAELITEVLVRFVQPTYGRTLATDFGPLSLKAVREKMVEAGHSRGFINKNVDRVRRMFRWASAEEMVPVSVTQALATLPGLRKGRTQARETTPVPPVEGFVVEATLPYLTGVVADMVRLQQSTGCRPGELCIIRPCDVDTTGDVWIYKPESHKTEHQGRERTVFIGPKAQDVLRPYLLREKSSFCFVPAERERKRNAERRANRQTPMTPSQAARRPTTNRRRPPADRYNPGSYRRAITRAINKANKVLVKKSETLLPHWFPNQVRHAVGTEVRKTYGLEGAQVVLGHADARVSEVYAERDLGLAERIMREVG